MEIPYLYNLQKKTPKQQKYNQIPTPKQSQQKENQEKPAHSSLYNEETRQIIKP